MAECYARFDCAAAGASYLLRYKKRSKSYPAPLAVRVCFPAFAARGFCSDWTL